MAELVPAVQSHIYALYLGSKQMSVSCRTFRQYLMQTIGKHPKET